MPLRTESFTHLPFVEIGSGGVDEPISISYCGFNCTRGQFPVRPIQHTKSERGHFGAVIQGDDGTSFTDGHFEVAISIFAFLHFAFLSSAINRRFEPRSAPVLLVAHLLHPVHNLAVERFLHGDMRHCRGRRRAVPVLLAGRKPDHIAGPDLLDRTAPRAAPSRNPP